MVMIIKHPSYFPVGRWVDIWDSQNMSQEIAICVKEALRRLPLSQDFTIVFDFNGHATGEGLRCRFECAGIYDKY